MKKLLLFIPVLMLYVGAAAQTQGKITGNVIDSLTNKSIVGAVVEVANAKTPDQKKYYTTAANGKIDIPSMAYGSYNLKITYLGYADVTRQVELSSAVNNLGMVKMGQAAQKIDKVDIEVQALRTSQKGDTVVYNASAFKVATDADTEGLLAKMPGIKVTDGVVEAQGEEVKKVLVDGKEFFGSDVSTAIKSLPAEVVSRVEVYNKLSDQAQFTGFDDGEGYKAINIVTSLDNKGGRFGKVYAGYGYPEYYIAGGNVNIFSGDSRLTVLGLVNNLNQQNFSFEDIVGSSSSRGGGRGGRGGRDARSFMVRPQSGVSTVASLGLNFSDTWGKKNQVEFAGSYFFNRTRNVNDQQIDRENFTSSLDKLRYYNSNSHSTALNYNHRFNGRLEYKISDRQSLMVRPSISWQSYDNDALANNITTSVANGTKTTDNSQQQITDSRSVGYNANVSLLHRLKLNDTGRTLTTNFNFNYYNNGSDSYPKHIYSVLDAMPSDSIFYQKILNNTYNYNLRGGVTYTERLTQISQLTAEYRVSYSYSDADRKNYTWNRLLGSDGEFNSAFDEQLSNIYNSGYLTHRIGPGYNLSSKKTNLSAGVGYQYSTLTADQSFPTVDNSHVAHSFDNVVYNMMLNVNFNPTNMLRVFARSDTDNPSVTQLRDVTDLSNTQYVSGGNPYLKPSYSNRVFGHYIKSNTAKGRTFMVMMGVEATSNAITDSLTYDANFVLPHYGTALGRGNQYSKPVNMDGQWSLRGGINYGFPLNFIKSNVTLDLGVQLSQSPSMIQGRENIMTATYYNGGVQIGSNVSENLDFTLAWNGSYNLNSNSAVDNGDNTYFYQSASAKIKWVFLGGLTFTGNVSYNQYKGITTDFNEEYLLCNAYIGTKIFKSKRGEISVGVNDILNQNKAFSRTATATYIQNVTNNVVPRYVGVQFIYNLRSFGRAATTRNKDAFDNMRPKDDGVGIQRSQSNRGFGGPPMR